ncbi:MAG: THUMP domain-containing protein [Acidihalobacter sp.]|jgi:tRNA(Ser,Leu) C12 N-acetylase TAN1
MNGWNVVVSTIAGHYQKAGRLLWPYGPVHRTDYFNVLTLRVDDVTQFLEQFREDFVKKPSIADCFGRVMPVTVRFAFQSPQEFETSACEAAVPWLTQLAGRRFHVRMHRRGFKGRLSSQHEEQFLDHEIIERTGPEAPATVDFDDPDFIIAVETLGREAGLSLWDRAARARYPFLKLD